MIGPELTFVPIFLYFMCDAPTACRDKQYVGACLGLGICKSQATEVGHAHPTSCATGQAPGRELLSECR